MFALCATLGVLSVPIAEDVLDGCEDVILDMDFTVVANVLACHRSDCEYLYFIGFWRLVKKCLCSRCQGSS